MTMSQDQFDDLLNRTALAALFYYPEIVVEDGDYNLKNDIDYCMEPMAGLPDEDADRLRNVVGCVIVNPSAHRSELLDIVIGLAPERTDG